MKTTNTTRKPSRKYLSPNTINGITCILGVISIFSAFIINAISDFIVILVGFGTSLISMGLINFLWGLRVENRVLKTVTDATMHAWSSVNKMRYNQMVHICFLEKNGKIIANIKHDFEYAGEFPFTVPGNLEIYSDYRGNKYDAKNPSTYIEEFSENGTPVLKWDNESDRERLCFFKYGRLYFSHQIKIPPLHDNPAKYSFIIHADYQLNDRLIWTFQEVSENAKIRIERKGICQNMPFHLNIDHPLESLILEKDNKSLQIDQKTGKINQNDFIINIERSILPSQGFAISWYPENANKNITPFN